MSEFSTWANDELDSIPDAKLLEMAESKELLIYLARKAWEYQQKKIDKIKEEQNE